MIISNQNKLRSKSLINAIVDRDLEQVRGLIPEADSNFMDPLGMKPIHYVIRLYPDRDLYEAIKLLKDHGADINATDHFGDRAVHFACCRENPIVALEILEQFGAEVSNQTTNNGANQLHFLFCNFSECNDFDNIFHATDFLLYHGVDEKQIGNDGKTPKEYAMKKFGKKNEIIWKVSATLNATAAQDIRERARTRRRSVGDMNAAASNPTRRRRKSFSVADLDQVGSVKNN